MKDFCAGMIVIILLKALLMWRLFLFAGGTVNKGLKPYSFF